jgi:hypothetical protein
MNRAFDSQTPASNTGGQPYASFANRVTKVLGVNATVTGATGYSHSTTGIPYAINGTATVVSQTIGVHLTTFNDPIKLVLGTGVHKDQKIIVKRKYVIGQSASIVPERAPARTVAIKEDVKEVTLTRYGGDIEMNLNLFLTPYAKEELDLKVNAQKLELERELIRLGYEAILSEGMDLCAAIARSSPAYKTEDTGVAVGIQLRQVFGAINRFQNPIAKLLTACRYASAYAIGTQKGSVMILPRGAPDLMQYLKPSAFNYSITGIKETEKGKITMGLQDVYADPCSGVRIAVHHPLPNYSQGAAHPNVTVGESPLAREVIVYEKLAVGHALNLETGKVHPTVVDNDATWRRTKFVCSSAILAAPGSNTGELLVGYPSTGCSTSHSQEQMMIHMRCYLGAAIYQPENIIILRDVFIEGVLECSIGGHDPASEEEQDDRGDTYAYTTADFSNSVLSSDGQVTTKGTGIIGSFDRPERYLTFHGAVAFGDDINGNVEVTRATAPAAAEEVDVASKGGSGG